MSVTHTAPRSIVNAAGAVRRPEPVDPAKVARLRDEGEAIDAARRLAERFARDAAERDRERRLPWEELALWSASGLGAITVPRDFGGADVSFVTLAETFVILCAADAALGQIPQNHYGVLRVLREAGSPAQQRRLFAEVLGGARLGNGGPERKSAQAHTVLQGTTRLTQTPAGLRLNGQRFYSTGALFAHRIPSRALDDEGRPVQVWVPREAPGVEVIDDWRAIGQRVTASGSVRFNDVAIDEQDVLPLWQLAERPGLYGPASQLLQAAIDQGIARAALDDALRFVRERSRPWMDANVARAVDDPYIIADVGRLTLSVHAAHEVLIEAARVLDWLDGRGRQDGASLDADASARASVAVAEAKVLTTRAALETSEKLFELAGSAATRAPFNLDRHWRNARTHTLHDPVRWKTYLIGNHHLNHALPTRHSWN